MTKQKFKNLGITLEGDIVNKEGNITYIRTPFRGEAYAVDQSDLIDETPSIGDHNTICTSSIINIEDWTQGISGKCLLQWEFHTEIDPEDGSVNSYVMIPRQKILIEWTEEDTHGVFESWLIIGKMYEGEDIQLNNKTTKNLKPQKLVLDLGGAIRVEF